MRIVAFALSIMLGAGVAASLATAQPAVPACPERLGDLTSVVCSCTAEAAADGPVWGSDTYTDDSRVCRAARHAGVIGESGGAIWVFERAGQASYPALTRNGVASNSWPGWRRSIAVRPASEASQAVATPGSAICPHNVAGMAIGTAVTCTCSIAQMTAGGLWGDRIYSGDSNLCAAARHAGMIDGNGGVIHARVTAGRESYPGTHRNDVVSNRWASYPISVEFDR